MTPLAELDRTLRGAKDMGKITLTGKGRRWVQNGHPWVYHDDVADGEGDAGELLPVEDPSGKVIGWGLHSDKSRIRVRLVTRTKEQPNRAFWVERFGRAIQLREDHGLMDPKSACRLVSGDADGLPGLVVDRYGSTLVLQCSSQGADRMRDFLVDCLQEAMPYEVECIVDRSDVSVRKLEGLQPRVEVLKGEPASPLVITDDGLEYTVDVLGGHKTGAYLDQSQNRKDAARWAKGRKVLDAFAYDGLFGIRAALAGASEVLFLEQNKAAIERIADHAERNGVADKITIERTNCMQAMRDLADAKRTFGLTIVDPPAFARNRREAAGAERGYVELNKRAIIMADPGGVVVSASCSYNVRPEEFIDFLRKSSTLAERETVMMNVASASPDHPQLLGLPESRYLKCAFLRVF